MEKGNVKCYKSGISSCLPILIHLYITLHECLGEGSTGESHIKATGVLAVPLRVKKHFWYLVFSLKRFTAGAFAVPLRVVSQKI